MRNKVLSAILCAALVFTSLPMGITAQASESVTSEVTQEASDVEESETAEKDDVVDVVIETSDEETITETIASTETIANEEVTAESTTESVSTIETEETETSLSTEEETKETETETDETLTEETLEENTVLALSDGDIASGTVDNVTWVIDKDGKLTVEGKGDFKIKGSYGNYQSPWYDYRDSIKSAVINLSDTTDASSMFDGCSNLTSIDLSKFDTSHVTDMYDMFIRCNSLETLDLSNFDTRRVIDMYQMFFGCNDLTSVDLEGFDTSNVTSMAGMFAGCNSLTSLDLGNFDTSNVERMDHLFSTCRGLTSLNLGSFDTSKVTYMNGMFYDCRSLKALDLSKFDTSRVTDMSNMFNGCSGLGTLDLSNFDTSQVTHMYEMFQDCSSLTSLNLSNFDTSKVISMCDMGGMFSGCISLETLDLSNFDTSRVTRMAGMFSGCSSLTTLDLSKFDTSQVYNMAGMFSGCSSLTTLDLSKFDTSQVKYMSEMFSDCSNLTSLNLSNFDTSQVEDMSEMFSGCSNLTTLDLSSFNLASLEDENEWIKYDSVLSNMTSLNEIHTPYNLNKNIPLPTANETDKWYMPDGTVITKLPQNLSYSVVITKNAKTSTPTDPTPAPTPTVTYTVTFNLNGGSSPAVNTQTVVSGEKAERPANPTLDGKTFGGWYSDSALTTPYSFSDPVTADITLYAKWDEVATGFTYKFDETRTTSLTKTYTGSAITPAVVVEYNGKALVKDVDYTVTYKNNINATTSQKPATAAIKGKGSYSGNGKTLEFTIAPVDLNSSAVTCPSAISVVKGQKAGKLTIIYNGKTLNAGKDYSIVEYVGADNSGKFQDNGTIKIAGGTNGNFTVKTGTSKEITVNTVDNKSDIGKLAIKSFEIPAQTYAGSEIKPSGYVIMDKTSKRKLTETEDYIVSYSNNNKVGTATVTFTGTGNYTGSTAKKTFKIAAPKVENITGTLNITKPDKNTSFDYDPNGVKLSADYLRITCGNRTLCENTDYKVSYKNNKKAGTAYYTVTFIGDFKGFPTLKNQTFEISKPTLEDKGVNVVVDDVVATKKGVYKSKPIVTYNGVKVNANEYSVYYYYVNKTDSDGKPLEMNNNNKIDPATDFADSQYVEIKAVLVSNGKTYEVAKNKETIYAKVVYKVWKGTDVDASKNIAKAKINLKTKALPYDGTAQTLALTDITITTKDNKEIKDKDFTDNFDVYYYNNINIGKATVIVKAKLGNTAGYIGSKTATFQITKPVLN
jgi:uncharacterized repeat protein (TIGR02543 family)